MKKGKKYQDSVKLIEKGKLYDTVEALDLVCKTAKAKFDETVEIHVKLGVDSRHADQQVRGAIVLPHGTGKTAKVLVFAKGPKADEAAAAGADYVGEMELVTKIQNENWFDFDVVVATPDMMGAPVVEGATVEAKAIKNGKAKKITVFKYKAKKNEKKKQGHRQPYTKVEITAIAL